MEKLSSRSEEDSFPFVPSGGEYMTASFPLMVFHSPKFYCHVVVLKTGLTYIYIGQIAAAMATSISVPIKISERVDLNLSGFWFSPL